MLIYARGEPSQCLSRPIKEGLPKVSLPKAYLRPTKEGLKKGEPKDSNV